MAAPEGRIILAVDIRMSAAEMSTWSPQRITDFFAGLAQVLSAINRPTGLHEVGPTKEDK